MESTIQTILVNTKPKYTVSIGPSLLAQCGELAAGALSPCRAAIVTDSTVAKLYLPRVERSLRAAGFSV